jgi:Zn-dependent M28 family amino/carboxypeptidase
MILRQLPFFNYLLQSLLIVGLLSCNNHNTSSESVNINADSLKQHILVLSSDSFQGRRPLTIGETRAVSYIQSTFAGLGLEPGNGNSFIQDVPMVEITPSVSPIMKAESSKGSVDLQNINDFVIFTERTEPVISLDKDQVVFAGFGIVAPEYKWNDYAGLNVKGKIVLVMVNDPGFYDSTLFKGHTMTYYGRWTYKYDEAARQGAKGCLIIHNTASASYPFNVVQNSNGGVKLHLDTRSNKQYQLAVEGWVTGDASKKLLSIAGKDTTLLQTAYHPGFKGAPLDLKLTASIKVKAVFNTSKNIIAKITGTKRPDEYIIYTAHWDHLGIGKPDETGDSIYNGALDNASGSAALLELARAFKSLPEKPERTILFLSVTAEEQGLLGSAYYAQHPIYPLKNTVAEMNMDGVNPYGKTKDVIITGAGQSDLEDYLKTEVEAQGRYLAPETHPEAGHYFRSDHFNFARGGVPALDAKGGIDFEGKGKVYGKKIGDEYTAKHYHRPSDHYDPTWTFEGGIQDVMLLFNVGKKLAFETTWPKWKEGSEFKAIRETTK